ncbi:holo-ACP synthase [Candidatus Babeliales bacterium]|nr:holo-ACP synthase [Candidatus Babeliales bacterium]MCF7899514.1 holo-ACP synthase [Candidatus Babeliales bacterium]
MILGIGTDIIKVSRFEKWQNFSKDQLLRIFSEQELADCSPFNLESLAARFATKEAFFKAFSASLVKLNFTQNTFSFMFSCQHVWVEKTLLGVPILKINWQAFEYKIGYKLPNFEVEISFSHEKDYVVSFVIISKNF